MEIKVNREQAEAEVNAWLDHKKILPSQREDYKAHIDRLIEATMYGVLSWGDGECIHHLQFPITGINEIKYSFRANGQTLSKGLHDVKPEDADGRFYAYISSLCNQNKSVVKLLDSSDLAIGKAYAIFFL